MFNKNAKNVSSKNKTLHKNELQVKKPFKFASMDNYLKQHR